MIFLDEGNGRLPRLILTTTYFFYYAKEFIYIINVYLLTDTGAKIHKGVLLIYSN